jgi:hypothetical protein
MRGIALSFAIPAYFGFAFSDFSEARGARFFGTGPLFEATTSKSALMG